MPVNYDRNLEFMNPMFRKGINVTVRDGLKWDMKIDMLPKRFEVRQTNNIPILGYATVIGKMVCKAIDIPKKVLELEHDPNCMAHMGLFISMRRAYGDNWNPNGEVTVLFFTYEQIPC